MKSKDSAIEHLLPLGMQDAKSRRAGASAMQNKVVARLRNAAMSLAFQVVHFHGGRLYAPKMCVAKD